MHRFLVEDSPELESGFTCELSPAEAQHAGRVLRLSTGDEVECFDGRGRAWLCRIAFNGQHASVTALSALSANESPVTVTLYQGMPKSDKLDLIVQKVTELGAARVVPVNMKRSVARAEGRDAAKKRERWQRIAAEAAKQCGRARVPELAEPCGFEAALDDIARRELMIVPYELHTGAGINALPGTPRDIGVLIGPEGGIAPEELDALLARGATPVTLGSRILRTETAAIAAVTMLMMKFGDIG